MVTRKTMNNFNNNADALELLRLAQEFRDEVNAARIIRWLGDDERDMFARLLLSASGEISAKPMHVYKEIRDIAAERYARATLAEQYSGQEEPR